MTRIFTYGTLRSTERNHFVLEHINHRFIGEASIPASFVGMWGTDIPLIVPDPEGSVPGEIYEVDDAGLARLDQFENVPFLYHRQTVLTSAGVEAEVYFPGDDLLPRSQRSS